jgi:hypothetical protein
MDAVQVEVDDLMQQSYVYLLTDPIGRTAPSLSGLATKLKTCAASAQIGRAVRNGSSLQQKERCNRLQTYLARGSGLDSIPPGSKKLTFDYPLYPFWKPSWFRTKKFTLP